MYTLLGIGGKKIRAYMFLPAHNILKIVWPFEIVGNLNAKSYLHLLVDRVGPALEKAAHGNQEVWFQQRVVLHTMF